ncbi:23932_t:CDS:2, partial [Entrophospora sp. SA101]
DLLNLQLSFDASSNCPQTSSNPSTLSIPSHTPPRPHTLADHRPSTITI